MLCEFTDLDRLHAYLNKLGKGGDITEICRENGQTSQLAMRRHLLTGMNFDLKVNVDLTEPRNQALTKQYFTDNHVLVAVMAPIRGPFGFMSHLNWSNYTSTMQKWYDIAAPIAWLCEEMALS